jgi:hypothetical protein
MADTLPTVKISDGHGGFIVINESDFDPKIHKKYEESAAEPEETLTKADLIDAAEAKGLEIKRSMTKADISDMLELASTTNDELSGLAEAKGIDVKGMTKAEIIDALKAES